VEVLGLHVSEGDAADIEGTGKGSGSFVMRIFSPLDEQSSLRKV